MKNGHLAKNHSQQDLEAIHCEKMGNFMLAFICWVTSKFDRNLRKIMEFHVLNEEAQLLVKLLGNLTRVSSK